MNAIQQRCRPKHQVLVLKCYPRTTKGAVDVKPNSSELSYLLFYATSRKTKIQKVGAFLEKKTASDVWRLRIGNVQVTLQILKALIEKSPKDLPLIAPTVLKILDLVLRSNDITMVESSIPTFEAFCEHHDASSLFADQAYLAQYESIVRAYASLASTRHSPGPRTPSRPVAMRWRHAGLEAIKSVVSADALSSPSGRQLDVLVPMVLENLWTDNEDFLEVLLARAQMEEKVDSERMLKRRTSIATVRTVDTAGGDPNPLALSGTAFDVDKLAEEDIGVLAMQCMKQMFVLPNRPQMHTATAALLRFISERVRQQEVLFRTNKNTGRDSGWAIKMYDLVSRWAPVQDRYVILVTTMDFLSKTQLADDSLQLHLVLMAMMGSLLKSDVNLIGLSVMDVLLGLIQLMKRLAQLPGGIAGPASGGAGRPVTAGGAAGAPDERAKTPDSLAEAAMSQRKELLIRIQQCMGDLATHVYYADQISDMISAILARLRPSSFFSASTDSSPRGENVDAATAAAAAAAAGSAEQPAAGPSGSNHIDSLFSVNVAKAAALKAVKAILLVANPRTRLAGNVSLSRHRVPVQVWENTQWLLRDPDGPVRKAYVDALTTWLDRETTKADVRARDDHAPSLQPRSSTKGSKELSASIAKRAASSASNRDKAAGKATATRKSHFLDLLHVSIYDNALQYVDYETDVLLLHVLLSKLVARLGVNAVRFGLPMVFRLQEEIMEAELPISKIRIGSLCHGYFWAVVDHFDVDESVVGRAILNEISRRRAKGFWVEGIHVPPPLLELVGTPGLARPQPKMPLREIESEALLPFDDRISLVEVLALAYQQNTVSPPTSPIAAGAGSPGRSFAHPILTPSKSNASTAAASTSANHHPAAAAAAAQKDDHDLPPAVRESLLAEWSRDAVLLAAAEGTSKSASLNGSRTGTTGTGGGNPGRSRLAVNLPQPANGHAGPSPFASQQNLRPGSSAAAGGAGGVAPLTKLRNSSVRSGLGGGGASPSPGSVASSARGAVASVDQLKLVLLSSGGGSSAGGGIPPSRGGGGGAGPTTAGPSRAGTAAAAALAKAARADSETSSEESMATYDDDADLTASEVSYGGGPPAAAVNDHRPTRRGSAAPPPPPTNASSAAARARSASRSRSREPSASSRDERRPPSSSGGPLSSNPPHEAGPVMAAAAAGEDEEEAREAAGEDAAGVVAGEDDVVPPVPPLPSGLAAGAGAKAAADAEDPAGAASPGKTAAAVAGAGSLRPPKRGARTIVPTLMGGGSSRRGVSSSGSAAAPPPPPMATLLGGEGGRTSSDDTFGSAGGGQHQPQALDLQALLLGIDSSAGESGLGHIVKPPY